MSRDKRARLRSLAIVAALAMPAFCGKCGTASAADTAGRGEALQILNATGVKGGLVVHLGCGDGQLTAALAGDRHLVQGLDTEADNVARAREHIRSLGIYGKVTAREFDGRTLPYAENVVNLLAAEDLGGVPMDEVLRVLVPGGAACLKAGGRWNKTVKPWPDEIDQWSHFLHDASNNAVADDSLVGPPRRLRWVAGPLWSRSHEFKSSLAAMVSAGGRIFYVFDYGLTSLTDPPIPERWTLVARDAFNGVLLWERPVPALGSDQWKGSALRGVPASIQRLLVADGQRLFVGLDRSAVVSALDAATGEVLMAYAGTEGSEEIRCLDGILLLRKGNNLLLAVAAQSGEKLWEASGRIQPDAVAAQGGRVFHQDGAALVCRRLGDGEELWRAAGSQAASLMVVDGDRVLLVRKTDIEAVSAASGETIWKAAAGVRRAELFVAAGKLWHWEGERIVGRDLATGDVAARLATDDVFTPGHHLRCYQSKGTEEFLITPFRGVEFVSVTGQPNAQNDWVRGACRYGIMPANGLLYVPPNPCFCYPGVKLTGFNALAGEEDEGRGARGEGRGAGDEGRGARDENLRLERGPAFGKLPSPAGGRGAGGEGESPPLAAQGTTDDWPSYRHDSRRTGATACQVAADVRPRWQVRLGGALTPPVVSDGRVFLAAKDEHTLHALDVENGRALWHYTAGGRIDSPPTVYGGLVLFGAADGCVYCLRAADGRLVWRFTAAPSDEQIVAFDQLESPWRVHGGVLVEGGVVYCTAGRSSHLDGGIFIFGLDPATGKVLHRATVDTWARTREDAVGKPFVPAYFMEGALSDVLVSQDGFIYLGQIKFDRNLVEQEVPYTLSDPDRKTVAMDLSDEPYVIADRESGKDYETHQRQWLERTQPELLKDLVGAHGGWSLGDRPIGLHVFSTAGFLDDSWFNRTFWMYSATWPGYYIAHRAPKTGQILVVGPERTYAVQAFPSRNLQSPLFTPAEKGYLLQADDNDNEPALDDRTRGTTKGWGFTRLAPPVWHQWVPIRVRGMVLAGEHLFVAGPPDVVEPDDPMAAFEGRRGAVLRVVAASGGSTLAETKLDAPPVFDGLIAAEGRLFLCTTHGDVLCLGEK